VIGSKWSIIGAAVAFGLFIMLSIVMLIVGFVTNTLDPIYISVVCSLLAWSPLSSSWCG
jgi:ABC-type nitrate/sulfonate/bicarbonate transport system permease component